MRKPNKGAMNQGSTLIRACVSGCVHNASSQKYDSQEGFMRTSETVTAVRECFHVPQAARKTSTFREHEGTETRQKLAQLPGYAMTRIAEGALFL